MVDEDGSSFPARHVAPRGSRRPILVAGLVIAALGSSILIARLSPAPDPLPTTAIATPQPSVSHAPVAAVASALPAQEWFSGPDVPRWEDLLVETGQVHVLRLGAPRLTPEPLARPGRDLLMRAEHGGTVCLCWQMPQAASDAPGSLDLVRTDDDRQAVSRTTILIDDGAQAGRVNGPERAALEPSPDGRFAYLARAIRTDPSWLVVLETIDLRTAAIVDRVELLAVLADRGIADRPTLRIAPDGRHALVMSTIVAADRLGHPPRERHAWVVDLDDGAFGGVIAGDAIADTEPSSPVGACPWTVFATPTMIARGCLPLDSGTSTSFRIERFDLAGLDLGPVLIEAYPPPVSPLIDTTDGIVYGWDPASHSLVAADLVHGLVRGVSGDRADRIQPDGVETDGPRPGSGPEEVAWSDGRGSTALAIDRPLAGSPDGRLLFAIGDGPDPGSTSGVEVFDSRSLVQLERWPARASYRSVIVFGNGRWLAAVGRAEVTASGGPALWGPSVTIHDALGGTSVLRIGDFDPTASLAFSWPGPIAMAP